MKVEQVVEPRILFFEILHQLHHRQVEIPSYHWLAELISAHYISHEKILLGELDRDLTEDQKQRLQSLLLKPKNKYETQITQYKVINQSLQPKAIQASVNLFKQIKEMVLPFLPLINTLSLTPQACEYYATWVKKVKLSQLKQFPDKRKLYLYLIAFLQHQYYIRQDTLIVILLRSVRTAKNSAIQQLKNSDQLSRNERRHAIRHLTNKHRHYRSLIDNIAEITHSTALTAEGKIQKIAELLMKHETEKNKKEQEKLSLFEQSLESMAQDKDYFDILEKRT